MHNKLALLRRRKGIKQCDLAKALDVSPSFLCKIEKGLIEPTDLFKNQCARYFDEKIENIFTEINIKHESCIDGRHLNNNLWSIRLKKNLKQNKLAKMIGCSPSYLSKIENGIQEPNDYFKKKCAKILKIKEFELFPGKTGD